jgi:hypothetical protein
LDQILELGVLFTFQMEEEEEGGEKRGKEGEEEMDGMYYYM